MRSAVYRYAKQQSVTGFVENLDDGRVKIVAEGLPESLSAMIESIESCSVGVTRSIERHVSPATGEYVNFVIKR